MQPYERLQKLNTVENLWIYLLVLLKDTDTPIYAWEIPAMIKKRFSFRTGKITPYRVLYRLETQGLVTSELENRKRLYKITKQGEAELKKAIKYYQKILRDING